MENVHGSENKQQVLLNTSMFGGFDKKQVLDTIDRIREENSNIVDALQEHINELTIKNKELNAEIEEKNQKIEKIENTLQMNAERIRQLSDTVYTQNLQIVGLKEKLVKAENEADIQREEYIAIEKKLLSLDEKSTRYDELSKSVGDILLKANQKASLIEEEAKEKALAAEAFAKGSLERLSTEIKAMQSAHGKLKEFVAVWVEEFKNHMNEIENMFESMEISHAQDMRPLASDDPEILHTVDSREQPNVAKENIILPESKFFR